MTLKKEFQDENFARRKFENIEFYKKQRT